MIIFENHARNIRHWTMKYYYNILLNNTIHGEDAHLYLASNKVLLNITSNPREVYEY